MKRENKIKFTINDLDTYGHLGQARSNSHRPLGKVDSLVQSFLLSSLM